MASKFDIFQESLCVKTLISDSKIVSASRLFSDPKWIITVCKDRQTGVLAMCPSSKEYN